MKGQRLRVELVERVVVAEDHVELTVDVTTSQSRPRVLVFFGWPEWWLLKQERVIALGQPGEWRRWPSCARIKGDLSRLLDRLEERHGREG